MDPFSLAQNIYSLASGIYDQVKKVKANKEQCQLLAERVQAIENAIKKLPKLSDKETFINSLERLIRCLKEIHRYMQSLSKKNWARRFVEAQSHEGQFSSFNQDLDQARSDLELALTTQILVNREKDKKAEELDRKALADHQQEIVESHKEILEEIKKIKMPDEEFRKRQVEAICEHFDQLRKKEAKMELDPKIAIPYFSLSIEEPLGQGTFGKVYRGRWQEMTDVAIKIWNGTLTEKEKQNFIREAQILQRIKTPYVPYFYGACLEAGRACIVTEYCPLGSLDLYLKKNTLTLADQHALALSIARGLKSLHNNKIIHRYFKSRNVLLTKNDKNQLEARISGFRVAKTEYASIATVELKLENQLEGMSPELIEPDQEVTAATDVFTYGTVLWELLSGRPAFSKISVEEFMKGDREKYSHLLPAYAQLIKRCWSSDPKKRGSMDDILLELRSITPPLDKDTAIPSTPVKVLPGSLPDLFQSVEIESKTSHYRQAKAYHDQKDFVNARDYYQMAIEAKEDEDFTPFATLLIRGNGGKPEELEQDQARAVALFKIEAEKGKILAIKNLVAAYKNGIGIAKDESAAESWRAKMKELESQSSRLSDASKVTFIPPPPPDDETPDDSAPWNNCIML